MQIKLPADLDRYVAAKLKEGHFASVDEVVAEALHVMRAVEEAMPSAQDDLRRELDLGLDDVAHGRVSDWNAEELKQAIRRHGRKKKAS